MYDTFIRFGAQDFRASSKNLEDQLLINDKISLIMILTDANSYHGVSDADKVLVPYQPTVS